MNNRPKTNMQKSTHNGELVQLRRLESRVAAAEGMNQKLFREISVLKSQMIGFRRSESDASVMSHISREQHLQTEHSSYSPDNTESPIFPAERRRMHQSTSPSRNRATPKIESPAFERLPLGNKVNSMEQVLQKVLADLKTLNARCGSQSIDIQTIYEELKNFDSKYGSAIQNEVQVLRTDLSSSNPFLSNPGQMSNTIKQLQGSLLDLQKNKESENNAMLRFENTIHSSLHDHASRLTEVERQSKEAIQHLRSEIREAIQMSNSTRLMIQKEVEQISLKIDTRLSATVKKLEEEQASSRREVEAALGRFAMNNSAYEQKVSDLESSMKNVDENLSKDLSKLREDQQQNQSKLLTSLSQLDRAVELLERGLSDEKEQLKAVVAAEIKTRTANVNDINFELREIVAKFNTRSSTMESAVGGMKEKCEKLEQLVNETKRSSGTCGVTTADTTELKKQLSDLEKNVAKLQKSAAQERASEPQEELLKSLTNVAESVQAVRAALVKKIEDFENETKRRFKELDGELDAIKSKPKENERQSSGH